MPTLPTASDVHVNTPLSNVSIAYVQRETDWIALKTSPVVPSLKQTDRYFEYDKADWLRDEAEKRAPASESAGGGWRLDNTANFSCDVFAYHKDVDDQIRANQDAAINLDRDAAEFVTQKMLIKREREWNDAFMQTSVWSKDFDPGVDSPSNLDWSAAASTPIADIRSEIDRIKSTTGYRPRGIALGYSTWRILQDNPDFTGRISFGTPSSPTIVTPNLLAQVLQLEEVHIAEAVRATSVEGAATDTFDYIVADDRALLYFTPRRPSLLTPSAMYTFVWTGLLGAAAGGMRMKRFRMEPLAADRVEGEAAWDFKVVAPDLATLFINTIS